MKHSTAFILACTAALCASAAAGPEGHFGQLFERVIPKLEQGVERLDREPSLPQSAWFREDRKSNRKELVKIVDSAIDELGVSAVSESRTAVRELERELQERYKRADTLRRKRISAPEDGWLGTDSRLFGLTRKGYDNRIEAEEEAIEALKQRLSEEKDEFRKRLAEIGLDLSAQEVEQLLATVEGDQFTAMCIAFDNVRRLTTKLEELTVASGEDVDAARRYYGMYVILLETLDRLQSVYLREIEAKHLPSLVEYEQEAERIIREARSLLEQASAANTEYLSANIRSSEMTLDAIRLYREYLKRQQRVVEEMNDALQQDIGTARNTYRTVTLSGNLASLIRQGLQRFDTFAKLTPPKLLVFQNEAVRQEFEKLTLRMKAP